MSERKTKPERDAAKLALTVQTATRSPGLPTKAQLRRWLSAALERSAAITVRLVGTAEGRRLNLAYRDCDYATNVLSFGYCGSRQKQTLAGDIVLCAPVLRREARAQGKTLVAHFAHLTIHGALHLEGHDHQRPRAAARMEALERKILARLGFPDPYEGDA
ncbi:MAG: rRNA maturation RNase YbeY [Betaproteobacteria bacterium]|nr:MAG: rRNA maturation RNase YbeY [Betaproteobacteria bacterium]